MSAFEQLLKDDPKAIASLADYAERLRFYNQRLNLIARTDVDWIFEHHVLHCLSLTRKRFEATDTVVDWGTGGGLPLIPLAIVFPETKFIGVDAVAKKTQAVEQIARELRLQNVEVWHGRAEGFSQPHTHSVSRATAPLAALWSWHVRNATARRPEVAATQWSPGLICLKGGDLTAEIAALPSSTVVHLEPLGLDDPYYHDKYIVMVEEAVCAT